MQTANQDLQKTMPTTDVETNTLMVKDVEVNKPIAREESASQTNMNILVEMETLNTDEPQPTFAQRQIVKTVQRAAVTNSPDLVEVDKEIQEESLPNTFQSTDDGEVIADQPEVLTQISPEPVVILGEQDHTEATIIYRVENPVLPEDVHIVAHDFSLSVEPMHDDPATTETDVIEDDERSVNVLLASVEDGMLQVEAEYMGELLVAMLADVTEDQIPPATEDFVESDDNFAQPSTAETINTEYTEAATESVITLTIEKEFSITLESLDPKQIEVVQNIVEEISVVLNKSQLLPEDASSDQKEIIEQSLEELCEQLFEALGKEYTEETIKRFIRSIMIPETFFSSGLKTDELSIDSLNSIGTREYRLPSSTTMHGDLSRLIKHKMQSYLMIGRYALYELHPCL